MVFTRAGKTLENHNVPVFPCPKACHRLLKKFLKLSQVLIAMLTDEPIKKKHYKAPKPLSHTSVGAGIIPSSPFSLHLEATVTATRDRMWRIQSAQTWLLLYPS